LIIPLTVGEFILFHKYICPRVFKGFPADMTWVFWVIAKVHVELADDLEGAARFIPAAWATDCMKVIETHF
jgi:hypothetical protein